LEVPIKRIMMGDEASMVLHRDSIADPASVDFYVEFAKNRAEGADKKESRRSRRAEGN
jgi:acetoacetyl-CoA synthetase